MVETDRLVLRAPTERDRARFVELFTDEAFTVFSDGVHDIESANARFGGMLSLIQAVPYAKQPIIERTSGVIVGYTGLATAVIDSVDRLEWGWRLVPGARGYGYATEATKALLEVADAHGSGEMLCIIAAEDHASRRVANKVGFRWWRQLDWTAILQIQSTCSCARSALEDLRCSRRPIIEAPRASSRTQFRGTLRSSPRAAHQ